MIQTRPSDVVSACMLLLLLFVTACDRSSGSADAGVHHPQERYELYLEPQSIVDLSSRQQGPAAMKAIAYFQTDADSVQIGTLNGLPETVFGEIQDVATDAHGNIYVLDRQFDQIRAFNGDGQFLYAVGRAGRGPGEFYSPNAIAFDGAGHLYVADLPDHVQIFDPAPNGFVYRETLHLGVEPLDICIMDGALYVSGHMMGDNKTIFQFTLDGSPVRSFGRLYGSDDPFINYMLSHGNLVCAPQKQIVAFVPIAVLPVVLGFRADGNPAWSTELSGYEPIDVIQIPNGSRVREPSGGWDELESASLLPDGDLMVQVATYVSDSSDHATIRELRSYVFSMASGRGSYLSSDLPLMAAVGNQLIVSSTKSPYPTLTVHRHPVQ